MNTKQMILLEQLVQDFYKSQKKVYNIVFEKNGFLYTGNFLKKDSEGDNYVEYSGNSAMQPAFNFFKNGQSNKQLELTIDFNKALGLNINGTKARREDVASRPHLILEAAFKIVSQINPDDYLNDSYIFPPVIYNLKFLNTGKELDFYLIHDEFIKPVSLVEEKN